MKGQGLLEKHPTHSFVNFFVELPTPEEAKFVLNPQTQHGWTGVPDNGNELGKFRAIPHSLAPLASPLL